jgi:hypothetical protein
VAEGPCLPEAWEGDTQEEEEDEEMAKEEEDLFKAEAEEEEGGSGGGSEAEGNSDSELIEEALQRNLRERAQLHRRAGVAGEGEAETDVHTHTSPTSPLPPQPQPHRPPLAAPLSSEPVRAPIPSPTTPPHKCGSVGACEGHSRHGGDAGSGEGSWGERRGAEGAGGGAGGEREKEKIGERAGQRESAREEEDSDERFFESVELGDVAAFDSPAVNEVRGCQGVGVCGCGGMEVRGRVMDCMRASG